MEITFWPNSIFIHHSHTNFYIKAEYRLIILQSFLHCCHILFQTQHLLFQFFPYRPADNMPSCSINTVMLRKCSEVILYRWQSEQSFFSVTVMDKCSIRLTTVTLTPRSQHLQKKPRTAQSTVCGKDMVNSINTHTYFKTQCMTKDCWREIYH